MAKRKKDITIEKEVVSQIAIDSDHVEISYSDGTKEVRVI